MVFEHSTISMDAKIFVLLLIEQKILHHYFTMNVNLMDNLFLYFLFTNYSLIFGTAVIFELGIFEERKIN